MHLGSSAEMVSADAVEVARPFQMLTKRAVPGSSSCVARSITLRHFLAKFDISYSHASDAKTAQVVTKHHHRIWAVWIPTEMAFLLKAGVVYRSMKLRDEPQIAFLLRNSIGGGFATIKAYSPKQFINFLCGEKCSQGLILRYLECEALPENTANRFHYLHMKT
jgi:hypothetical protein